MNQLKGVVKALYVLLRTIFYPIILLFRPTGLRRESIVASATVAVFIFVIQPIVAARLGGGYAVATTAVGAALGYSFLMWGKEFEH
jgi:hypothetical protein